MCNVNAEEIIVMFSLCKRGELASDLFFPLKWLLCLDAQNMQEENLTVVSLLMMVEGGLETA